MQHSLLLKTILEKAEEIKKEFNYEYLCASHIAIAVADFCNSKYTGICISDNLYPSIKYEEERLRYIFKKEVKLSSYFRMALSKANREGVKEEVFDVDACQEIATERNSIVLSADIVFLCALKQYQKICKQAVRSDLSGNGVFSVLQDTDEKIYDYVIENLQKVSAILNEKIRNTEAIRDWKPAAKFAEPQELAEMFFNKIKISSIDNVVVLKIPHFFGKSDLKLSIYKVDDVYYIHDNGCAIKHLSKQLNDKQKCERVLKKVCHSCWIDKNRITGNFTTANKFLYYLQKLIFVAHADLYYTKAVKHLYYKEKGFVFPSSHKAEPIDSEALLNELKKTINFNYDENSGIYYWLNMSYSLFSMCASFLMETLENRQIRISDKRKGKCEGELFEAFYWDNDATAPYGKFISKIAARFGAEFDGIDVYLTDKQENFYTAILKFFNLAIILSEFGHDIDLPKLRQKEQL